MFTKKNLWSEFIRFQATLTKSAILCFLTSALFLSSDRSMNKQIILH